MGYVEGQSIGRATTGFPRSRGAGDSPSHFGTSDRIPRVTAGAGFLDAARMIAKMRERDEAREAVEPTVSSRETASPGRSSLSDVAHAATAPVPNLARMEAAFGTSLQHVKVAAG